MACEPEVAERGVYDLEKVIQSNKITIFLLT